MAKVTVTAPSPTILIIFASRAATLAANKETASKPAEVNDSSCWMGLIVRGI